MMRMIGEGTVLGRIMSVGALCGVVVLTGCMSDSSNENSAPAAPTAVPETGPERDPCEPYMVGEVEFSETERAAALAGALPQDIPALTKEPIFGLQIIAPAGASQEELGQNDQIVDAVVETLESPHELTEQRLMMDGVPEHTLIVQSWAVSGGCPVPEPLQASIETVPSTQTV